MLVIGSYGILIFYIVSWWIVNNIALGERYPFWSALCSGLPTLLILFLYNCLHIGVAPHVLEVLIIDIDSLSGIGLGPPVIEELLLLQLLLLDLFGLINGGG